MSRSLSSWATAKNVAGVAAHSLPKRIVSAPVTSPNQSSLSDTAVAAKAAQHIQSSQAS